MSHNDPTSPFPTMQHNIELRALEEAKECRRQKLGHLWALPKVLTVIERYPGAKVFLTKQQADHFARKACFLAGYKEFAKDME